MKKYIMMATLSAAALATNVQADGFYVGGSVGPVFETFRISKFTSTIHQLSMTSEDSTSRWGLSPALVAGWGKAFGLNYLGLEARAGWTFGTLNKGLSGRMPDESHINKLTLKVKPSWNAGAVVRAGRIIADTTMVYVLGGVDWQNYKFTANVIDDGVDLENDAMNTKFTMAMFVVGAGFQWCASEKVDIFMEAQYKRGFKNRNFSGAFNWNNDDEQVGNGIVTAKYNTSAINFALGARYNFGV